jgi:hypothetical protein
VDALVFRPGELMQRTTASNLLQRAAAVYDDPANGLSTAARRAWHGGFSSAGGWMRQAMIVLRNQSQACGECPFQRFGILKYALALSGAVLCVAAAINSRHWGVALLALPVFYLVETQMVFLFPLMIDGVAQNRIATARHWTIRAGGTVRVMRVVVPLAVFMLFGGFAGRGFVRSWCLGCLAVVLWYEHLREMTCES